MAEIAGLHVKISADPTELERGMKKAAFTIDGMSKSMKKAAIVAARYGSALAAAGFAGATVLTKLSLGAIDATSKLARELGTTTESLGTLQRAASYAGVSAGDLENSLRILNRTIGDGIQGNEQVRRTFQRLGLSLTEIAEMNADEKIVAIGEAMKGLGSNAERAKTISELFGRSGMKMTDMVMGGAEAMKIAAQEAKSLGIAVSEIDAQQIENANDAWTRVTGAIGGFFNQVAIKIAPLMGAFADKLNDAADSGSSFGRIIDGALSLIFKGFGYAKTVVQGFNVVLAAQKVAWAAIGVSITQAAGFITDNFADAVNGVIRQINNLTRFWNDFTIAASNVPGLSGLQGMQVEAIKTVEKIGVLRDEAALFYADAQAGLVSAVDAVRLPGEHAEIAADQYRMLAEAARAAAAEQVAARGGVGGPVELEQTDAEKTAAEKAAKELEDYRKQLNDKLTALVESQLAEEQLLVMKRDNELALLKEGLDAKLIAEEDYRAMVEEIEMNHVQRMIEHRKKLSDATQTTWEDDAESVLGEIDKMTSGVASGNRAMFEISKVASISKAILKSREAITSAYAFGTEIGGPPLGAVMAGISAAATAAQIAQLASSTYGGGGGATTSGGDGGASVATAAQQPAKNTHEDKGAFVQVNLQGGNLYSADQVRGLITAINDQIDSGVQVRGITAS